MPVLVSDTSVIIDLERARLLERAFQLPHELCVPDLLFERELRGALGDQLLALGLSVVELDPPELAEATRLGRRDASLSVADTFAFALAKVRTWTLLTGDSGLRQAAAVEQVEVHGALWVIDQLEICQICGSAELEAGLGRVAAHPRCRLPRAEITRRLNRFRGLG